MTESVESLAALVNGTIRGDQTRVIDDAAAIEAANSSAITFVMNNAQAGRLKDCRAGAVFRGGWWQPKKTRSSARPRRPRSSHGFFR